MLLAAGGLLTELKSTSKNPSLGVTDLWQLPGYISIDYAGELRSPTRRCSPRGAATSHNGLDVLVPQLANHAYSPLVARNTISIQDPPTKLAPTLRPPDRGLIRNLRGAPRLRTGTMHSGRLQVGQSPCQPVLSRWSR